MYLWPTVTYELVSWSWLHLDTFLVNFVQLSYHSDCNLVVLSSHGCMVDSRWLRCGVHMDPVGATLLPNSGRMAISTTFAEDGTEPETCHLCFTALPLKTWMCMCAHVYRCVCVSVHACVSACMEGGRIISQHLLRSRGWKCFRDKVYACLCVYGREGVFLWQVVCDQSKISH